MYIQLTKVTYPEPGKEKKYMENGATYQDVRTSQDMPGSNEQKQCSHSNQFDQTCKRAFFTLFYQWQYNPIIIENLPKFNKTLNENFNLQLTCQIFFLHINNKNKSFYVTIFYKKYIKPLIKRIKHTHLVWLN